LTLKKNSVLDKAYCEVQKRYSAVNVKTIKITNQAEKAQRSRGKQEKNYCNNNYKLDCSLIFIIKKYG